MTPERWQQIKEILEHAFGLPDSSWSNYLDSACGDDSSLRMEVESFLTVSSDDLQSFLDEPVLGRPSLPDNAFPAAPPPIPTGDVVNELRLVDLAPYTRLRLTTRGSEYQLTVVTPFDNELLVQGGQRFPEATSAQLLGDGVVAVGRELRLRVGERQVITSRVRSIQLL